ncbi:MAG: ribonuclease HII [bacterium]|nr:ribonuclease HII [bacterium]
MRNPTFRHERELIAQGYCPVGIDEAGCGPLAGPVIAAACIVPLHARIALLRDSKLLSAAQRERALALLAQRGAVWGIGAASVVEIDTVNIRQATHLAMRRAVAVLLEASSSAATHALVDAWHIPNLPIPQRAIIGGDRIVKSIAAASIIAKVHRDRLMVEYDAMYPEYGFSRHKGYGTKAHLEAIAKYGITSLHRATFCHYALDKKDGKC